MVKALGDAGKAQTGAFDQISDGLGQVATKTNQAQAIAT